MKSRSPYGHATMEETLAEIAAAPSFDYVTIFKGKHHQMRLAIGKWIEGKYIPINREELEHLIS